MDAPASDSPDARIERIMRSAVPGLSIAAVKPDGLRWAHGYGLADIAARSTATPQSVYMWFSMTKIATATAVVHLADQGRLGLDDPVVRHYPRFGALRPQTQAAAVTVRHLLSHSSGLVNPIPISWIHAAGSPGPDPHAFLDGLLAKHASLQFAPGARASYTNLGYLVLGEVVASVSGQSYEQYVKAHILDPLRMTRTGFSHTTEMNAAAATPYQKRWSLMTGMMRLMLPRGSFGPAADGFVAFNRFYLDGAAYGGLVGSLEDAARFLRVHLRRGELDGERILSPESATTMQTIATLGTPRDLGLGWFRPHNPRAGERRFVEHLGGGGGFWNCMRIYPDASLGVIMMGNATSYDHEAIARAVADRWWSY